MMTLFSIKLYAFWLFIYTTVFWRPENTKLWEGRVMSLIKNYGYMNLKKNNEVHR